MQLETTGRIIIPVKPRIDRCVWCFSIILLAAAGPAQSQSSSADVQSAQPGQVKQQIPDDKTKSGPGQPLEDKRVFGVLPNYRTAESDAPHVPISVRRKFLIATKDSFDYPVIILAGAFAGLSQLDDSHPQFDQGLKGYLRRWGTSYADQVIGNYLTEASLPALLHEDPRYFRKGHGSVKGRAFYAATRIFICRTDSGGSSFNFSEVVGNGLAATTSMAYYTDQRKFGDVASKWGTQLSTDAASQVLKEFWPDIKRYLHNRHANGN